MADNATSDVKVPEDFQKRVAELMKGINKEQCDFIQNACMSCMNDMNDKETEFSTEDMPK